MDICILRQGAFIPYQTLYFTVLAAIGKGRGRLALFLKLTHLNGRKLWRSVMQKFVFSLTFSLTLGLVALVLVLVLAIAPAATAAELPKCRHVAGFEPKATCEARNQRAQWQAEETARLTANKIAVVLERENAQADRDGFIETAKGLASGFVSKVQSLF
jgi:hypothetical protein